MRNVEVQVYAAGADASAIYALLSDFREYPRLTNAVRSVAIEHEAAHESVSTWEVNFREGILRWTERDRFDDARRSIEFVQLEGDMEVFDGSWQVTEGTGGCAIVFQARLDLGIPTLADLLEPIAESALRENIALIIDGILAAAGDRAPAALAVS